MAGRFITLEGGEGTGKSTQATLLARRLNEIGVDVVVTREPGGSAGAEAIRHVILSGAAKPLGPDAEALLFAAARADHMQETIRPALLDGKWVICDRFIDSTRAYQGILGDVDKRLIRGLERIAIGDNRPSLTLILDFDPAIGMERAARRRGHAVPDRFESEALDFHQRLRAAYRNIARSEPQRCVVIDADGSAEQISEIIWEVVSERLFGWKPPAKAVAS